MTVAYLAVAGGPVAHVHALSHAHATGHFDESAAAHVHSTAHAAGLAAEPNDDPDADLEPADDHDHRCCATCLLLAAPVLHAAVDRPALQPTYAFPALPVEIERLVSSRAPLRIACRGPPAA
ncbi:MAG TPA: hypothetical protein VF796_10200 [Humisphaera sp.]